MQVKLVSITHSVEPSCQYTAEGLIAYCARVSSPNQENTEIAKLLKYLIEHGHWSPFEMVDMTVEIITSRAISPQILRHRSFSFQEFSQRYAEVHTHEPVELRMQGDSKQGSAAVTNTFNRSVEFVIEEASNMYDYLISMGVSRESARMVLPMCTTTKLYMKGSVRSWIHYLKVRLAEDTQLEHRLIAKEVQCIFIEQFPIISEVVGW
jgi:thymidylate synthase (FAD)